MRQVLLLSLGGQKRFWISKKIGIYAYFGPKVVSAVLIGFCVYGKSFSQCNKEYFEKKINPIGHF